MPVLYDALERIVRAFETYDFIELDRAALIYRL